MKRLWTRKFIGYCAGNWKRPNTDSLCVDWGRISLSSLASNFV